MDGETKSWDEIRGRRPVNKERRRQYDRLLEAEHRLYTAARRLGATESEISEAYEASAPDLGPGEDDDEETLFGLARSVAALGGRLEVVAVFDDDEVTLLSEPEPEPEADGDEPW